MALTDINSTITSLATPGGITIIKHGEAPLIKGRRGLPTKTATLVVDAVHHPDRGGNVDTVVSDAIRPIKRIAAYFRVEVLAAVVDPNGTDPWWIVVNGEHFQVESVEDWTAGGFWLVRAVRVAADRSLVEVSFRSLTTAQATTPSYATLAGIIMAGGRAMSPLRSFRFVLPSDTRQKVGVVWPLSAQSPSDTVIFRAINGNGNSVDVGDPDFTVNVELGGITYVVAVLPRIVSSNGTMQYEVI